MADNRPVHTRTANGEGDEQVARSVFANRPNAVAHDELGSFMLNGRRFVVYPPAVGGEQDCALPPSVGTLLLEGRECRIIEQLDEAADTPHRPAEILTARELQIATLVAHGQCTKRIAYQLRISEWTVQTHLRRIYAKLGVAGRAEMVFRCASRLSETG